MDLLSEFCWRSSGEFPVMKNSDTHVQEDQPVLMMKNSIMDLRDEPSGNIGPAYRRWILYLNFLMDFPRSADQPFHFSENPSPDSRELKIHCSRIRLFEVCEEWSTWFLHLKSQDEKVCFPAWLLIRIFRRDLKSVQLFPEFSGQLN